ncbi:hypothetical protein C1646_776260 [Rhizophagus diaphanus]|nr:hypothetical protein C1646_776260 [Rhizophagus diaphanus] [Rhizophagus sp. MUCL 43196]
MGHGIPSAGHNAAGVACVVAMEPVFDERPMDSVQVEILRAGLIDTSKAIRIGYDEAIALANYLEINNYALNSIQQQISYNETSLDNNTNAPEIIDNEDDQDQNSVKSCRNLSQDFGEVLASNLNEKQGERHA